MKVSFKYKGIHSCEAAVLCCIDFRFWQETAEFVRDKKEGLGIASFDFPKLPGAVKAINESAEGDIVVLCTSVPCDLHHIKKIVIINHADCGAYGGSKKFNGDIEMEQKFHEKELIKAKNKLFAKYPGKEIILVYAKLVDDEKYIEFIRIN